MFWYIFASVLSADHVVSATNMHTHLSADHGFHGWTMWFQQRICTHTVQMSPRARPFYDEYRLFVRDSRTMLGDLQSKNCTRESVGWFDAGHMRKVHAACQESACTAYASGDIGWNSCSLCKSEATCNSSGIDTQRRTELFLSMLHSTSHLSHIICNGWVRRVVRYCVTFRFILPQVSKKQRFPLKAAGAPSCCRLTQHPGSSISLCG